MGTSTDIGEVHEEEAAVVGEEQVKKPPWEREVSAVMMEDMESLFSRSSAIRCCRAR